jgi:hypothetical protein
MTTTTTGSTAVPASLSNSTASLSPSLLQNHNHHHHQQQQQQVLTIQQREMQEKHGAIVPTVQLTFANCKKLKSFIKDYSYNCGKSIKINNNSQAVTYVCSDTNCQWKIIAVKPRSDRNSNNSTSNNGTEVEQTADNETTTNRKGQFKITKVHNVHSYHCSSISKLPLRQQRLLKQQAQAAVRASFGQQQQQQQQQQEQQNGDQSLLTSSTTHKGRGRPRKQQAIQSSSDDSTVIDTLASQQPLPLHTDGTIETTETITVTATGMNTAALTGSETIMATEQNSTHSDSLDESLYTKVKLSNNNNINNKDNLNVNDTNEEDHDQDSTTGSGLPVLLSNGPFTALPHPILLSLDNDKEYISPVQCFIRKYCIEVFTASFDDITALQQLTLNNKGNKKDKKPISVGQVGIRCSYCHKQKSTNPDAENDVTSTNGKPTPQVVTKQLPPFAQPYQIGGSLAGSVYYPLSIRSIYSTIQNLMQLHFIYCYEVPRDVLKQYEVLRLSEDSSHYSLSSIKRYWEASASCLGIVDTLDGIRYSSLPPPSFQSMETTLHGYNTRMFGNGTLGTGAELSSSTTTTTAIGCSNEVTGAVDDDDLLDAYDVMGSNPLLDVHQIRSFKPNITNQQYYKVAIVIPDDKPYTTLYTYLLMDQMISTVFTDTDRIGKRYSLINGFPGLACKHCISTSSSTSSSNGQYNNNGIIGGRFFPSTIKTLADSSKTLNVIHNHIMRCYVCPIQIREALDKLRYIHDDERSTMDYGYQKQFFQRIWDRLHNTNTNDSNNSTSIVDIGIDTTNSNLAANCTIATDSALDTNAATHSNNNNQSVGDTSTITLPLASMLQVTTTASSTDTSAVVKDTPMSLSSKRTSSIIDSPSQTSNKLRKITNINVPI